MRKYKENLMAISVSQQDAMTPRRALQVGAFCSLISGLSIWQQAIARIATAELEEESCSDMNSRAQGRASALVQQSRTDCAIAWQGTKDDMCRFKLVCDNDLFLRAELVYGSTKSWADDVFDGLWPSTHPGADDHEDVWRYEDDLFDYASEIFEIEVDELYLKTARAWRDSAEQLGGTGKKFR